MKPMLNIATGAMFDFGKPLPKVDMAPEHYIDYTPNETQRQVDAMLVIHVAPTGEFDGKMWRNKLREFIEGSPKECLFIIDSCSPIA